MRQEFQSNPCFQARQSEGSLASHLAQVVNIWVEMLSDITMACLLSRETGCRTASPHTAVTQH